jgi:diacylglycerol diphosphate phosphatase / phosphatidate phosphatase
LAKTLTLFSILAIIYSAIDRIVKPFNQPFSLKNYTIQYPFAVKERIPIPVALVISAMFPIFVIALYTLVIDGIFSHQRKETGAGWTKVYRLKDRLWELNCGILGLFLAHGAAFVITGTLKNLGGKPRPDLIARCQPILGSVDAAVFGLSTAAICTQTDAAIMADGFRSFPSGHSSSSFAGLSYLSLYLAAKLHVLDNRGEVWRTVVVLIPTMAASCVAMSRIMDARHHPFDVLFGSALGILVGWASYRQYFPPLSETWRKGRAYPIRTWGTKMRGPPGSQNEAVQKDPNLESYHYGAGAGGPDAHVENLDQRRQSVNVFRDQVSRSQRQRNGDGSQAPAYTVQDGAEYMSPRQWDGNSAVTASSSDDEYHQRNSRRPNATEGFEMQAPRSGRTDASAGHAPPSARSRGGDVPGNGEDTEYLGQTGPDTHPGERVLV